ncbi:dihydroorotase [Opitutales bacterium]|jgi:dihydroorotase|nr:dihydroorotase [Opitutales bacterium]
MEVEELNINLIGARILDPIQKLDCVQDLYIRRGKMFFEQPPDDDSKSYRSLNLNDHVIMPGILDLCTHTRVPGTSSTESIFNISQSAAKGGFTAILAMPDTLPQSDNPGTIRYIEDRIKQSSLINIWLTGCLTIKSEGNSIAPLGSLKDAGIIAVSDSPRSCIDSQIFINSVKYAKMFNLPVIEFPQDSYLSKNGNAHVSSFSLKMGLGGLPSIAEEISVQRAISVAKDLDYNIHLSSISSVGSVSLIRDAKKRGIKVTADVTAHHLILNENAIEGYDTNAKLFPPLRGEKDRDSLQNGLLDGTIDAICSAHQPHPSHEKNVEYDKAPAGAIGLETCMSASIQSLSTKTDDPYPVIVQSLSYGPHKILQLPQPAIKKGNLANLTIINNKENWTYHPNTELSEAVNSPLINYDFQSCPVLTIVNGQIIYSK